MPFGIIWESFFFYGIAGHLAAGLDPLSAAGYLRPLVCVRQHRWTGGLVELVDSGFTPTLSHCMTYAWSGAADLKKHGVSFSSEKSEPNYALVCGMLATCRRLYFAIALAATLLMATLGTVYIQRIAAEYLSWQIYATWGLYVISTFINLYIGYYSIVLTGIGDVFRRNKANIIAKGVFLSAGIVGLLSGFGILSLGVAYFASGFVMRSL